MKDSKQKVPPQEGAQNLLPSIFKGNEQLPMTMTYYSASDLHYNDLAFTYLA